MGHLIELGGDSINKRKIIIPIIILLALVAGVIWFTGIQDKNQIEDDVISYLDDKNYNVDEDIKDTYVVNMGENDVKNAVVVTFEDEPEVDYFYSYEKGTNKITQIDVVSNGNNQSLKHQES